MSMMRLIKDVERGRLEESILTIQNGDLKADISVADYLTRMINENDTTCYDTELVPIENTEETSFSANILLTDVLAENDSYSIIFSKAHGLLFSYFPEVEYFVSVDSEIKSKDVGRVLLVDQVIHQIKPVFTQVLAEGVYTDTVIPNRNELFAASYNFFQAALYMEIQNGPFNRIERN